MDNTSPRRSPPKKKRRTDGEQESDADSVDDVANRDDEQSNTRHLLGVVIPETLELPIISAVPKTSSQRHDEINDRRNFTHRPVSVDSDESAQRSKKSSKANVSKSASSTSNEKVPTRGIRRDLPPMTDPEEMIRDLTEKARVKCGFDKFLRYCRRTGHKLKCATMFSGTEAPLIAIQMINKALGEDAFEYEHVFSAEIEPYIQAYISRNFNPMIIFRDVCEMADSQDGKASTAFGGRVPIPSGIDLLTAGSSCIDFSTLNTKKKRIGDGGESGRTFFALLKYVEIHKPKMLILENVRDAPWPQLCDYLRDIGYPATYVRIDTKNYYLPQTRQRGYLLAIHKNALDSCDKKGPGPLIRWPKRMESLERPASSPFSDFQLPQYDPDLYLAMTQQGPRKVSQGVDTKTVKWESCRIRHTKMRQEGGLGPKRPITKWREGGRKILPPAHFDKRWFKARSTERVNDLIDIMALQNASSQDRSFDVLHKSCLWDVSQNADRCPRSHAFGIIPCITPTGMLFDPFRGRALHPVECLLLQGIPRDAISLTTETARDVQKLAGNAMSVTVVAASILSALSVAYEALELQELDTEDNGHKTSGPGKEDSVRKWLGLDRLHEFESGLGSSMPNERFDELLEDAYKSAQNCPCEGASGLSKSAILTCTDCFFTVCKSCGGNPSHQFSIQQRVSNGRMKPEHFTHKWRGQFPPQIRINAKLICEALQSKLSGKDELCQKYLRYIQSAFSQDLKLSDIRRSREWVVVYQSKSAKVELKLERGSPKCLLFILPPSSWATDHPLREIFKSPVAECSLSWTLFKNEEVTLKWVLPIKHKFQIRIHADGTASNPSWLSSLGLLKYKDQTVPQKLIISIEDRRLLRSNDMIPDISGTYEHLPNCGTSCSSLYRKMTSLEAPLMYLFHDPDPTGDPKRDPFVFSGDPHRYDTSRTRLSAAKLDAKWRPWQSIPHDGAHVSASSFETYHFRASLFSIPPIQLTLAVPLDIDPWQAVVGANCKDYVALFGVALPLSESVEKRFCVSSASALDSTTKGEVQYFRDTHEINADDKGFMSSFGWALRHASQCEIPKRHSGSMDRDSWVDITSLIDHQECSTCAPEKPRLKWKFVEKTGKAGKKNNTSKTEQSAISEKSILTPFEHPEEATRYERAIKSRPPVFKFRATVLADDTAHIWAGVNIHTLAHRAFQGLGVHTDITVRCRLLTGHTPEIPAPLRTFKLMNNEQCPEAIPPPRMRLKLRPEQLRSLKWMQERESSLSQPFSVDLIEEAIVPSLHWKFEVQVRCNTRVQGGILADEVSFGKTMTSLALMHSEFEKLGHRGVLENLIANSETGRVDVAATLIICPSTLTKQWKAEIEKFSNAYNGSVIIVESSTDFKKLSIELIQKAKIIIVSWTIFNNPVYLDALADIAAIDSPAEIDGRAFTTWLQAALNRLPESLNLLQNLDAVRFWRELEGLRTARRDDAEIQSYIPSRRMKGVLPLTSEKPSKPTKSSAKVNEDFNFAEEYMKSAPGTPSSDKQFWRQYKGAPFHLFRFNRVIIDEFAYLEQPKNQAVFSLLCKLKASKRWILSGTPPLGDFVDVQKMAALLDVSIGVDDSNPLVIASHNVKNMRSSWTQAEEFQALNENRSFDWHKARHELAQRFLDHYARQNRANMGHINCMEQLVSAELGQHERVMYQELLQHLVSNDLTMEKPKSLSGHREAHVDQLLSECDTPEKALLKCSTICALGEQQKFASRIDDYKHLELTFSRLLTECIAYKVACQDADVGFTKELDAWVSEATGVIETHNIRDPDVVKTVRLIIAEECSSNTDPTESTPSKEQLRALSADKLTEKLEILQQIHRDLVYARWQWRFAEIMFTYGDMLASDESAVHEILTCENKDCAGFPKAKDAVIIQSLCGHVVCQICLERRNLDTADLCPVELCNATSLAVHHVKLSGAPQAIAGVFGTKIDNVVKILRERLAPKDKALLFVQDNEMITAVNAALSDLKIGCYAVHGPSKAKTHAINAFKEGKIEKGESEPRKVLILSMSDESAAGSNLTMANHIIFLSPLLVERQYKYEAAMTQAIGRARRYGQNKIVHVYRFFALDTLDVQMLELRERRSRPLYARFESEVDSAERGRQEMSSLARHEEKGIALVPRSLVDPKTHWTPIDYFRLEEFSEFMAEEDLDALEEES